MPISADPIAPLPQADLAWILESPANALFRQFPIALAIVTSADDAPLLNDKFIEEFEPSCLAAPELKGILDASISGWRSVQLPRRDGANLGANVQALRIDGGVMIVIDTVPPGGGAGDPVVAARLTELERTSTTDALTGAWNRMHFERSIATEIGRSLRFKQPLSLVMFDVDHFKDINDAHGHLVGDAVLKQLVDVVQTATRAADQLYRWGGDEFALVAVASGHRGAATLAEKLRAVVASTKFSTAGTVTISLGVAEHRWAEDSIEWFARADAMLYAAKQAGRNRVSVDDGGSSDGWAAEHGRSALRLVWEEAYESGEPTIDREHGTLFVLANNLIDLACEADAPADAAPAAMDRLIAHIAKHFANEEEILERRGYSHVAAHRLAHARLISRAKELREHMRQGHLDLGELVDFVAGKVISQHLLTMDRQFFSLFRS